MRVGDAEHDPVGTRACPRPRSPRGGTPGSTPASPRHPRATRWPAVRPAARRCPPARSTCRPRGSAGRGAEPARHGPVDLGQVGAQAPGSLRGPDAEEVEVAELRDLGVGVGETQPARGDVACEQLGSPGSKNVTRPAVERLPLDRVGLDAEHLVPELGHGCGVGGPEIAATDDGDAHAGSLGRPDLRVSRGGGGQGGRDSVPCLIARLASSSAATSAPPIRCGCRRPRPARRTAHAPSPGPAHSTTVSPRSARGAPSTVRWRPSSSMRS